MALTYSRTPCNAERPLTATSGATDERICEFQPPPPRCPLSAARSHTVWLILKHAYFGFPLKREGF